MGTSVPEKIDAFIKACPEWQAAILTDLRKWAHEAGEPVSEHYRWGAPHFDHNGIMFGMMAFKKHINLFFHKGALVEDIHGLFDPIDKEKGTRSVKFTEGDVPNEKQLKSLFASAIEVNKAGLQLKAAKPKAKAVRTPSVLMSLLKTTPAAMSHWKSLPPSHKREYIDWISDAKREQTRENRLSKTLEMLSAGKGLNDKYR